MLDAWVTYMFNTACAPNRYLSGPGNKHGNRERGAFVGVLNGFGVIFVLDHRAFAIAKGSHHTEMLAVIMGRDAPDLTSPTEGSIGKTT